MARDLVRADVARSNAAIARAASEVCPFEAIRVLVLRGMESDLSTIGAIEFQVHEARGRPGWFLRCRMSRGKALLRDRSAMGDEEIRLRVKSDVGALELAGLSLAAPRSRQWARSPESVRLVPDAYEILAPTPDIALFDLRHALALGVEFRIRRDLAELDRRGVPFDIGVGWGQTVRHVDPTTFDVEAEAVQDARPARLPADRGD